MRGQRKSTLVERHAPDAIATAVTATCASVDATAPCAAPLPPAPAAAAAAITSRAPTSAAEATASRGATWSTSTHPTVIRARVAVPPRATVAAGSSARRRPSIPESETAAVDAGDCVMRASPGSGAGPASISSSRLASRDEGHSHGTAREWRRGMEGESTGVFVWLQLGTGSRGTRRVAFASCFAPAGACCCDVRQCHLSRFFPLPLPVLLAARLGFPRYFYRHIYFYIGYKTYD